MPLISKLIMNLCLAYTSPTCVEELHVCMRDDFQVNFWDELSPEEEKELPWKLRYCEVYMRLGEISVD